MRSAKLNMIRPSEGKNMALNKSKFYWLVILLIASLVLAACGSDDKEEQDSDSSAEKTDITLQLAWTHEYSSAPFYVAIENDHFADANLNVTLAPGGFNESGYVDPIEQVLSGNGSFGLAGTPSMIEAQAAGKPVVSVLTVLQRSPFALISLSDANINTPADLVGKTITVTDGSARQSFDAFLVSQGISSDEVTIVPRTSFGVDPLVNGDVDVLAGWVINEGIQIQEAGLEPTYILLSDYGIDEYSFTLFTTEELASTNPELVDAVVDAVVAGMQDTIANPEQAVDHTMKFAPELDREQQSNRLYAMLPLMNLPNTPLGLMNETIWSENVKLMVDNDVIAEAIDPADVYTNQFVENN